MTKQQTKQHKDNGSQVYFESLRVYNFVYVINTLVRYVGSWLHNSLLNQIILTHSKGLVAGLVGVISIQHIVLWGERLKSIFIFLGLVVSYFLTESRRDVNWATKWWLNYSGFSFLFLGILGYFHKSASVKVLYLVAALFLSDIVYGFFLGVRDGQRPRAFVMLARLLSSHAVQASDKVKNLLTNRKLATSIAEVGGMYFFWFVIQNFKLNLGTEKLLVLTVLCSLANFLCGLYFSRLHDKLQLHDPLMSVEQSGNFSRECRAEIARWWSSVKGVQFGKIFSFVRQSVNLTGENEVNVAYKTQLFIVNFIIMKCLFFYSKSNFFQIASSCPNYFYGWEKYARSILLLTMVIDMLKSYYRKRTGRHLIKSLDMLSLSTVLSILTKIAIYVGKSTNDARWIVFLASPMYALAQSFSVQALNHLFEVWSIDFEKKSVKGEGVSDRTNDTDGENSSPSLISLRYNALSIGSFVVSKFLNNTVIQVVLSVFSVLFNIKLRLIANKAELV